MLSEPIWGSAEAIARDVAEFMRPPIRIPVSKAAVDSVRIAAPGGTSSPWSDQITPYMCEPMDCLPQRRYESVVFVSPARTGKTQALIDCWIGHTALCSPADMAVYLPTQVLAHSYSKQRVDRLHRNSPDLRDKLSRGTHDDAVHMKAYRNGMLLFLAWPTSSQVAQRDLRQVALSDYDSMPDDVDGEGEPFQLARKRTQSFLSRAQTLVESSPKRARVSVKNWKPESPHQAPPTTGGILPLYNRGDRRRWYWSCKHCSEWFEAPALPSYDAHQDPERAGRSAYVPCPHCGGIHTQADKLTLNRGGRWIPDNCRLTAEGDLVGTPPDTRIASFWLLGCAAAFQTWESLVVNWIHAQQDYERTKREEPLKTTCNIDQGIPYIAKSLQRDETTATDLLDRSEPWVKDTVPEGVCWLQAAVDVQKGRFAVAVIGHGKERERWLVDRYDLHWSKRQTPAGEGEPLDPAGHAEDWAVLDKVLKSSYTLSESPEARMAIRYAVCDSGGAEGVTERAYAYWRRVRVLGLLERGKNFRLVKGDGSLRAARVRETFPDSTKRRDRKGGGRGDVPVLLVGTNHIKDALSADLTRADPGPGFLHLPGWLPSDIYDELVSEVREERGWKTTGANETWDLLVYDMAAFIFFGGERIDWTRPPLWVRTARDGGTMDPKTLAERFKVI